MARKFEELLGPRYRLFTKDVDGRKYRGYVTKDAFELEDAVGYVLHKRTDARKMGVRYFAGIADLKSAEGVRFYVIPDATEPEIADLADVGVAALEEVMTPERVKELVEAFPQATLFKLVHEGRMTYQELYELVGGSTRPAARARMRKFFKAIYRRFPYEIYYADRKGCRAAFINPVTRADAAWIEQKILGVNPEAMDIVERGTLRGDIARRGEMRLWWD